MHLLLFPFLALVVLVSSLFFLAQTTKKQTRTKPPGPPGLPIIGNLHRYASSSPHLYFYQLSKTYGPLLSLQLGSLPTVVVSSAKIAQEVMKTNDHIFSSRPKFVNQQKMSYNGLAMSMAPYGDYWRNIRKVCAVHLLSPRKVQSFCSVREDEVRQMMGIISRISAENRPVNLSEMVMSITNDVVCRVAFGRRNDSDDDARSKSVFHSLLRESQELSVGFRFSDYFPCLGWIDKLMGSARLDYVFKELDGVLEEIIEEHVEGVRMESDVEDIVDVLLGLRKENSFGVDITHDHIKAILMDVFVAGTDTSSATVVMAMTELMKNPEAMKRVQEEARKSTRGKMMKSMIKAEDLEELVYLKAVVKETWRLHPVAPLLIPRVASKKCSIEGYEIQKKTLVFVSAWAIGRDPDSWENPEEFRPERFMCDKAVDFKGQDFELIPFGSGRRICPGIHMGVAMVELALANLIYSFDWTVPTGMEKEILDTSVLPGITTHKKIPLCLLAKVVA